VKALLPANIICASVTTLSVLLSSVRNLLLLPLVMLPLASTMICACAVLLLQAVLLLSMAGCLPSCHVAREPRAGKAFSEDLFRMLNTMLNAYLGRAGVGEMSEGESRQLQVARAQVHTQEVAQHNNSHYKIIQWYQLQIIYW